MPHVQIEGPLDLTRFFGEFAPVAERMPWGVRKIKNAYLAARGTTLLLETLVLEGGAGRNFLIRVEGKGPARHTVRLEPVVPVDRTRGVVSAVAWVGRMLRDRNPGCSFGATNIEELRD